jgi:hypothetical protein
LAPPSLIGVLVFLQSVRADRLSKIFLDSFSVVWLVGFWQLPFNNTNIQTILIYTSMILKSFKKFNDKFFSKNKPVVKTEVEKCYENMLEFMYSNNIKTWDDFVNCGQFKKNLINLIIDKSNLDMNEINEVKFLLRVRLSNKKQLEKLLKNYEDMEDYERCQHILSEIESR